MCFRQLNDPHETFIKKCGKSERNTSEYSLKLHVYSARKDEENFLNVHPRFSLLPIINKNKHFYGRCFPFNPRKKTFRPA